MYTLIKNTDEFRGNYSRSDEYPLGLSIVNETDTVFNFTSAGEEFAGIVTNFCNVHMVDPVHIADVVDDMSLALSEYVCLLPE